MEDNLVERNSLRSELDEANRRIDQLQSKLSFVVSQEEECRASLEETETSLRARVSELEASLQQSQARVFELSQNQVQSGEDARAELSRLSTQLEFAVRSEAHVQNEATTLREEVCFRTLKKWDDVIPISAF